MDIFVRILISFGVILSVIVSIAFLYDALELHREIKKRDKAFEAERKKEIAKNMLYRAKKKSSDEFVYGRYFDNGGRATIINDEGIFYVDKKTLSGFSGFYDCCGNPIFAKDRILYTGDNDGFLRTGEKLTIKQYGRTFHIVNEETKNKIPLCFYLKNGEYKLQDFKIL